ncbi:MAG: DUF7133 domain-containing protein [Akkermansiaceae bacterium]
MKHNAILLTLLAGLCTSSHAAPKAAKAPAKKNSSSLADVQIANNGLTVMYGNAIIEKLQEEGTFETYMQSASNGKKIQFRSLAYTGDQVGFRIRATKFGLHLAYLLDQWKANRVLMAFGSNESYAGAAGLAEFETQLSDYLTLIKDRHGKSDFILVSPIAAEKASKLTGPDHTKRNADIKLYTDAMAKIAAKHKVKFVDLYTPTLKLFSNTDNIYTIDGQHLNDKGSQQVGKIFAGVLIGDTKLNSINPDSEGFQATKKLIQRKHTEVAQAYHPSNGISYYGLRARSYEYNTEIPHFLKLANILDTAIWKQSQNTTTALAFPKLPILKIDVKSKKPKNGLGVIKKSEDDLKDFQLAKGFSINCFASSEDYPELINPLQMQFDPQGRLWVCCFASYPHPLPGTVANDTILIFEDTDGDGKADKRTVFAHDLLLPDGFVFYKKGIVASVSKKLIYLEDTDGDSVADVRQEVLRGFDNSDTHHSGYLARSPHGDIIMSEALFHRGQFETLHGVVHTKDTSIMSFDMDSRKITVERQTESPNPWKVTFNKWGESIQFYGGGQIIDADIHNIATPMGSSAKMELGMPFRYDKGCSATFVESPHFPKEWQGGLLTSHLLSTNEINYTPLKLVNGAYKSAGKKLTIVKSKNKIFRPSDIRFGPDGALYVTDFYYPIIGHAQHSNRDKNRDYANGRIWRITHNDAELINAPSSIEKNADELIQQLKNPFMTARLNTRLALENQPTAEVNTALAKAVKGATKDDLYALELLWLMERQKDFRDTSLIKRLVASSELPIKRAAVRSLRWWADALGSDLPAIVSTLAKESDDRLKISLVGVLSHLQLKDPKWTTYIQQLNAKDETPLAYVKEMAGWKDRPGLAAEYPIAKIDPLAYINNSVWLKNAKAKTGEIYFNSDIPVELILGHKNNPFLNITMNDTPLLIASGSPHSKDSQSNFSAKKGINKLDYSILNSGKYAKKAKDKFEMYLSSITGNKPAGVTMPSSNEEHQQWKKQFEAEQSANWKEYALTTFKQNCANCHAIETKAVGPALKGLFGLKHKVTSADGSTKETIVDEDYLRRAITNPTAEYPQGYQPIMPAMPLSDKEVDALVRWIKEMK